MSKKKNIMDEIYTSFDEVNRAYNKIRKELWNLGVLWDGSKLDAVECIYEPLQWRGLIGWMGFYEFLKCKGNGNIHFPAVYNGLDLRLRWIDKNSTIDVFRHEFGHALSDRYPGALKKGGVFRTAFGGPCDDKPAPGTDPEDWEGRCVTPYAATKTREDFAETFMLFMKHKGKIPAKFAKKPAIRKKWKAVAEIVKRVAAAKR
jgi:hypothetical protein